MKIFFLLCAVNLVTIGYSQITVNDSTARYYGIPYSDSNVVSYQIWYNDSAVEWEILKALDSTYLYNYTDTIYFAEIIGWVYNRIQKSDSSVIYFNVRREKKHGSYLEINRDSIIIQGQYRKGKKHDEWLIFDQKNKKYFIRESWHRGKIKTRQLVLFE